MKKEKQTEFSSIFLMSSRQHFVEVVETGITKRKLKASRAVQDYLVNLLEHFLDVRNLFQSSGESEKSPDTLAEMLLKASSEEGFARQELLKKLGDRSLYISGFFGDSLSRKLIDVDYYMNIGGTAYASLAEATREDTTAHIYRTFSLQFGEFVDVLTYISQQSAVTTDQGLLRLYERYLRTGSSLAKERLVELGVLTVTSEQAKLARQN